MGRVLVETVAVVNVLVETEAVARVLVKAVPVAGVLKDPRPRDWQVCLC